MTTPTPTTRPDLTAPLDALKEMLVTGEGWDHTDNKLLDWLHALQDGGMSQCDIQVHIEVLRGQNEVLSGDPDTEDRCLGALDLVCGVGTNGLRWGNFDPPQDPNPDGPTPVAGLLVYLEVAANAMDNARCERDALVVQLKKRGAAVAAIARHGQMHRKQVYRILRDAAAHEQQT